MSELKGAFILEDFQQAKPFANFFPGIAGLYGIPMWAFYVNRGQAVTSFGTESKDKAILEFQPANKAYRLTSSQGFRTFLKVLKGQREHFYEPFCNRIGAIYKVTQRMTVTSHDLTLEELNSTLGIKTTVNYFTMPEEPFAALVRRVTVENVSRQDMKISAIDGLPVINPYGLRDWASKNMSRTVEAWVAVRQAAVHLPFYQLSVEVADTPQVTPIDHGHFYFAFDTSTRKFLPSIVESAVVFGQATDFLVPEQFLKTKRFSVPPRQQTANRMPAAMVSAQFSLKPGARKTVVALAGFAHHIKELQGIAFRSTERGFIDQKQERNQALIENIKDYCWTHSAVKEFDAYCGHNFLDNVLRGGLPVSVRTAHGPVALNVYSRKHGDLERDYNYFVLSPTFLSQGNGNYRDVNQNRRNDIWFNQDVGTSAIVDLLNLSQADGYNPLIIKGLAFVVDDAQAAAQLLNDVPKPKQERVKTMFQQGFMPGDLLNVLVADLSAAKLQSFLSSVLRISHKQPQADFGEGYWSDHWTYNLDLLESYLRLYPEHLGKLLLDERVFDFYLSDTYVLPRDQRYVLTERGVRQYHSLKEHDASVAAKQKGHRLRINSGKGEVYRTILLVKLLCLLSNKVATLDPSGIGVEMEGNRPNWYDALNGLPGLLGSSVNETYEVKRLAIFVLASLEQLKVPDSSSVSVFSELANFMDSLRQLFAKGLTPKQYWEQSNTVKENYRSKIRLGIDGAEQAVGVAHIKDFLNGVISRTSEGLRQARNAKGQIVSYFYHEVTHYQKLETSRPHEPHVRPLEFKRHDLPLFLEGFVHALRVDEDAESIFAALHKSDLYDRPLGMYKVTADLSSATQEIGRSRIFPRGWLENESIWLHMEYKLLLELLRRGLNQEFYQAVKACLIPLQDPRRYGRSVFENSSFLASSAHADRNLHGQGFVARLSGSTAEFIHIWLLMNAGLKPFTVDARGELAFTLRPVLPEWLFCRRASDGFPADTYAFKLWNSLLIVYHNPKRRDTFGRLGAVVRRLQLTYPGRHLTSHQGDTLTGQAAHDVRSGKIQRIDAFLE